MKSAKYFPVAFLLLLLFLAGFTSLISLSAGNLNAAEDAKQSEATPPGSTSDPSEEATPPSENNEAVQQEQAAVAEQAQPKGKEGRVESIPTDKIKIEEFKTEDGKTGLSVQIPGGRPLATPAVVDGMVFVGGGFGSYEFYAFDAKTLKPVWAIKVSDDGPTAAVVSDGFVCFNTESCTLFVVEASTGKMAWSRWLGDPLMSQPAIANGRVYMAYPGAGGRHLLICLDLKTGKEIWKQVIAGDIISAPVVSGGCVYLTTFDGTVYCYKAEDGKPLWHDKKNGTSAPWIVGDQVYVTLRQNVEQGEGDARKTVATEGLAVLEREKGAQQNEKLWNQREAQYLMQEVQQGSKLYAQQKSNDEGVGFGGEGPSSAKLKDAAGNVGQNSVSGLWTYQGSRPVVTDGVIYNGQGDVVQATDAKSGKEIWRQDIKGDLKEVGGHLVAPPAVVGDKVLVGTSLGEVVCFGKADGKEAWRWKFKDEQIRYQVAAAGGRVYIGTVSGKLLCIDTSDNSIDGWTMWGGGPEHNGSSK